MLVDFHAEATSEKIALGWYLDGRVSVIVGTHTHVATADEGILPRGTAFITDAGMTGAHDSIIGVRKELALRRMLTLMHGLLVEIDPSTGRALRCERIRRTATAP